MYIYIPTQTEPQFVLLTEPIPTLDPQIPKSQIPHKSREHTKLTAAFFCFLDSNRFAQQEHSKLHPSCLSHSFPTEAASSIPSKLKHFATHQSQGGEGLFSCQRSSIQGKRRGFDEGMSHNSQQSNESKHDDDSALTDFLASLMDYTPTIPDELVEHYLAKSGFQCPDVRLTRLVAVATQKFVAEVASDALQHCKARQSAVVKDKKQQKDKRLILMMEDLSKALREYGVNMKHQEYFADSPSTGMDPTTREE